MIISDISVKRPVAATVLSLLILSFGVLSFRELPLREYPDITPPRVSISTDYRGASAQVVESRITQVIEDQISGIEGVEAINSSSVDGSSRINVEFDLSRQIDEAANDVRDRVSRVVGWLPEDAEAPRIAKADSDARPIQWFSLTSPNMDARALTDYAERFLADQFTIIDGVANVYISGAGRYAMRIWPDRTALTARNLTVLDIENALRRQNIELPAGRIDSAEREFTVRVQRAYETAEDFAALTIAKGADGHLVRLGEVARVELGQRTYRNEFRGNGIQTVGLGIVKQSKANTLEVLRATNERAEAINDSLPQGMTLIASSDDSVFIENAINSVYLTLLITMALVAAVIYVFLGTVRAMVIPTVTIPVCLTAAFIGLALFGFSVNLITLLGLVLAIGLVVDDSIVVLENCQRRVEEGEPPLLAAVRGTRQVSFAVIATTAVLVAVFVPMAFLDGVLGVIFQELAVTVGTAVIFSSLLALTLTTMMCSKLLSEQTRDSGFTRRIESAFNWLRQSYNEALRYVLPRPATVLIAVALVCVGAWQLFRVTPTAFAPEEDQGVFFAFIQGPEGASFEFMQGQLRELEGTVQPYVESGDVVKYLVFLPGWGAAEAVNSAVALVTMAPWDERDKTTREVMGGLTREWQEIPGIRAFPFMRSGSQRGGGGQPVQLVIGGTSYEQLYEWQETLLERIREENPRLTRVQSDYRATKPQLLVQIDKTRAADLGVHVADIGRTLQLMMSEMRITTYMDGGEEYDVIVQAESGQRQDTGDLTNIHVRSASTGELIPLSNLVNVETIADAGQLRRYNRLRAITISANLAPDYTLGEALTYLENLVQQELPATAQIDYKGESLEYKESESGLLFTFLLALLIVFLVLAAQFESFLHPLIIMVTVPLAALGALIGLLLTGETLNIYSNIGIVILIGISTKNGILIVEFINQMRDQGLEFTEAVLRAAEIRLRPVIMTALSTIMGSIPLILASGAGAESRTTLGIVILSGVAVGTVLTLFVIPVFYHLFARGTRSPGELAAKVEALEGQGVAQGRG